MTIGKDKIKNLEKIVFNYKFNFWSMKIKRVPKKSALAISLYRFVSFKISIFRSNLF